jgi:hypothetical protein
VEELYGTWYQSGSFSLINVGNGFQCLRSFSFLVCWSVQPSKTCLQLFCCQIQARYVMIFIEGALSRVSTLQVRALFAVANCFPSSVIFIDEIDSILSARKTEGGRKGCALGCRSRHFEAFNINVHTVHTHLMRVLLITCDAKTRSGLPVPRNTPYSMNCNEVAYNYNEEYLFPWKVVARDETKRCCMCHRFRYFGQVIAKSLISTRSGHCQRFVLHPQCTARKRM